MDPTMRQRVECEVCGSRNSEAVLSHPFTDPVVWDFVHQYYEGRVQKSFLTGVIYTILHCADCGFLWQKEILDDRGLELLYSDWIKSDRSREKREQGSKDLFAGYAREILVALSLVDSNGKMVQVLDHGMGWGYWCLMARAFRCEASGTEISEERRAYAAHNGITVVNIDQLPQEHYHFINAEQSFEHIPFPRENMLALAAALRPGGVIRIAVPDAGAALHRLRNPNWKASKDPFHPLEHINCFTHKSLVRLGAEAGLTVVQPPVFPVVALGISALARQILGTLYYRWFGTKLYFRKPTQS